MAYKNFIPSVWAEGINRELERNCVFAEDCNREYEGKVKKQGESVTILGIGKPTIRELVRASSGNNSTGANGFGSSGNIEGPEELQDASVIMYINQIAYFNYMIGDIDKAQAINGIMDAANKETSEGLANKVDKYIAALALDSQVSKLFATVPKVVAGTAGEGEYNVLDVLDYAQEKLFENDVSSSTKIVATVSPRFFTKFRKEYTKLDTDNSDLLKHGRVAMYGNMIIKLSNNVERSQTTAAGDTDNIMLRTQRAIAYAKPLTHSEPFRPEGKFADAVKGYILYDAKVIRPKEIININVKY